MPILQMGKQSLDKLSDLPQLASDRDGTKSQCLKHCAYTAPHSDPNGSGWQRPGACRVGWGMGVWSNPFVPHRQLLSSYDLAVIQRNPIKLQVG